MDWLIAVAWAIGVAGLVCLAWPVWRRVRTHPVVVVHGWGSPARMVSPFFIFMPAGFALFPLAAWLIGSIRSGRVLVDHQFAGFCLIWLAWLVVMQLGGNRQFLASIEREHLERSKGWLSRDDGF